MTDALIKTYTKAYRTAKKKVISSAQGGRIASQEESKDLDFESIFSG